MLRLKDLHLQQRKIPFNLEKCCNEVECNLPLKLVVLPNAEQWIVHPTTHLKFEGGDLKNLQRSLRWRIDAGDKNFKAHKILLNTCALTLIMSS